MFKILITTIALLFLSANVFATDTYPLGQQDPLTQSPSPTTLGGGANSIRGWEFTATSSVYVNSLSAAVSAANGCQIKLELWDVTTQTVLADATITATGNPSTWTTANITTTALTSGSNYIVTAYSPTCSQWYTYWNPAPSSFRPTGTINYVTMRYGNSGDVFPTATLANTQYGIPDIGYTLTPPAPPASPASIPTLSEWTQIALAFMTLGLVFWYQKRESV